MSVVAIIQARMGSTRLPGKALLPLAGESMLDRVINRTRRAVLVSEVIVATSTQAADDKIVELGEKNGWKTFRGSEPDVLDRYYRTAQHSQAEVVVRITSDCPLIEPQIIDQAVREFLAGGVDYVSNTLSPRTFPRGLDVEVFSFACLERAWNDAKDQAEREHVTLYIYRHPEKFTLKGITNSSDYSDMRWTVDTPEDLAFVRRIYDHFGHDRFTWHEVLTLLEENPAWLNINAHVKQKATP